MGGGEVYEEQRWIILPLIAISHKYQFSISIQGQMPIAYYFRFCCHFCHFTFDINLLSINPLREVLKVTATKNKTKLEVLTQFGH